MFCCLMLTACSFQDTVECYCCNNQILIDDSKSIDDEFICQYCYHGAKECDSCHKKYLHENDDTHFNYCYSCLYDSSIAFQCVECGLYKTVDEKYVIDDIGNVCAKCALDYMYE